VSISAYRHGIGTTVLDADFSPQNYFTAYLPYYDEQMSQELQLLSKPGGTVDWIAGLYYLNEVAGWTPARFTGDEFRLLVAPHTVGTYESISGQQRVNSYAGYAQATVHLGWATDFTGGLRFTTDDVTRKAKRTLLGQAVPTPTALHWRLARRSKSSRTKPSSTIILATT